MTQEQTSKLPEEILSERFAERYKSQFEKLNQFNTNFPKDWKSGDYLIPRLKGKALDNATVVTEAVDAFNLNPPHHGFEMTRLPSTTVVARIIVPYLEVDKCVSDQRYFNFYFDQVVNKVIDETVTRIDINPEWFGSNANIYVAGIFLNYERPGQKGKIFRSLDNSAGYELRFYSNGAKV